MKTIPPPRNWVEGIVFCPAGRAWVFPERRVVFTQASAEVASAADTHALVDLFAWLTRKLPGVDAPIVVHDWRSMRTLTRESRAVFVARRAELPQRPEKLYVAVTVNPLLRMALQTAALTSQMVTRAVSLELVRDPFTVLDALGVGEPDPSLHLRLRDEWQHGPRR